MTRLEDILSEEAAEEVRQLGEVDILVGIPSYNNARTIAHVVQAVQAGLAKYFPKRRSVVVNSDGGSTDGTPQIAENAALEDTETILIQHPVYPIHRIATAYHGILGKGSAFRAIFAIAHELHAKACAVVDSDLRSISPEWIELLIEPVLYKGFDYVAPLYMRHKYDGTITNTIVYPLTRALYGKRIRQPIGGEFGFSGRIAEHFLSHEEVWHTDVARYGIDIWMTTTAIADGFKVCQAYLGAKIHDAKDPTADLTGMFTQVVGTVFQLVEQKQAVWPKVQKSSNVPTFGFRFQVGVEPVSVNLERMIRAFKQGLEDLVIVWERTLSAETMDTLLSLSESEGEAFRFPDSVWVRAIYDLAITYHQRRILRENLLRSMIPLYLGKVAALVIETQRSSAEEVEARIERLALTFEEEKPYLLKGWFQVK